MSSVWQSISQKGTALVPGLAKLSSRRRREYLAFLGFIAPNFILFGIFTFWPLVYSLLLSFKKWNMISPTKEFVGLANYAKMIGDDVFWQASRNTLYLAGGTVFIKLALALGLALLLNQKLAGRSIYLPPAWRWPWSGRGSLIPSTDSSASH